MDLNTIFDPAYLNPELQKYVTISEDMRLLRHPLVYQVPYHDSLAQLSNHILEQKTQKLNEAIIEKNYHRIIWLHERPYRPNAFQAYIYDSGIKDKDYWELLSHVWIDTEYPYISMDLWSHFFSSDRKDKQCLMNPSERVFFRELPDEITIYRGQHLKYDIGISWTLDEALAKFFAYRFNTEGTILTKTIKKESALCYFSRRGESEILLKDDNDATI